MRPGGGTGHCRQCVAPPRNPVQGRPRVQGLHTPTGPLAAGGLPSLLEKAQPQRPLVLPAGRPAVPTLMGATWMGREGCRSREAVSGTQRAQEGPQRVWPSGCLPPALRPPPWGASFSSAAGRGGESPDPSSELWTRQLFVTAPWGGHSGPLAPPTRGAVGPGQAWHCWAAASGTRCARKGPSSAQCPEENILNCFKARRRVISHFPPLPKQNPLTRGFPQSVL